jgi:hypothetical protein
MAAAAAAIARRNAQEGEGGKRQRGLKRRSSYVTFLATHEPDTMDTLKAELGTCERKPTAFEVAHGKALPGLECIGHEKCVRCCTDLRDNKWFQVSVIGVIFLAGVIVGIQTYPIDPGSQTAVTLGIMDTISKSGNPHTHTHPHTTKCGSNDEIVAFLHCGSLIAVVLFFYSAAGGRAGGRAGGIIVHPFSSSVH